MLKCLILLYCMLVKDLSWSNWSKLAVGPKYLWSYKVYNKNIIILRNFKDLCVYQNF